MAITSAFVFGGELPALRILPTPLRHAALQHSSPLTRDGKVVGVIGNGPGRGDGQEGETGYIRSDSHGNMWTGDTTNARITEWVKSAKS